MQEENEYKPKKFDNKEEVLEHFLNLLNTDSDYIKNLYRKNNPFQTQRNKIVELTNYWKISTDNFIKEFLDNMEIEINLINNKKSNLSRSIRKFLIDLDMYIDHYLNKDDQEIVELNK